jgi:hypothetical protein
LAKFWGFRGVTNATAGIEASLHDASTLRAQVGLERRFGKELEMTSFTDNSFPYVLICSIFATVVSLASVWIVTAQSFAPALVA